MTAEAAAWLRVKHKDGSLRSALCSIFFFHFYVMADNF
jgi:hypothetical protein